MGAWIEIIVPQPTNSSTLVAPLVGAWIEITHKCIGWGGCRVAPLVGAWIEITYSAFKCHTTASLPSWERGLKSLNNKVEIVNEGRSPRGSVD